MASSSLDLHDKKFFPAWAALPDFYDTGNRYTQLVQGISEPKRHWCFLAEITGNFSLARPVYRVRDVEGHEKTIAFYLDTDAQAQEMNKKCKVGYTLAIMYARKHRFADGQFGIRIEQPENVAIFSCGLEHVFRTADKLKDAPEEPNTACPVCGRHAEQSCIGCGLKYCGKESGCHTKHWKKGGHRQECAVRGQVAEWKKFNWKHFDRYRPIPPPYS